MAMHRFFISTSSLILLFLIPSFFDFPIIALGTFIYVASILFLHFVTVQSSTPYVIIGITYDLNIVALHFLGTSLV